MRLKLLSFLTIILAWAIAACTPQVIPKAKAPLEKEGEVYLYLQPMPQEAHFLTVTVSDISVVTASGSATPLLDSALVWNCQEMIGIQKRLASKILEPGIYKGISITIEQVTMIGEDGEEVNLLVPSAPLSVSHEFTVYPGKALALFLALSPKKIVTDGFHFTPVFSLFTTIKQPDNLLGFVGNGGANMITVFNKQTMEVVKVIGTGVSPGDLALDQNRKIVYVALPDRDKISAIDAVFGEVIAEGNLQFADEPKKIALSSDGSKLVSANYGSKSASIFDADSLIEVGRINFTSEPTWVVTGQINHQAFVLHAISNSISIIDIDRGSIVNTVLLNETPVQCALSQDGKYLYVITRFSPNLLVVDLSNLKVSQDIFIGGMSTSIKVDRKSGQIYIGKKSGEIVVIEPSSLMFTDSFFADGSANRMTIDTEENSLLVASSSNNTVQKFNLVSTKSLGILEIEEGPHSIVVMGE